MQQVFNLLGKYDVIDISHLNHQSYIKHVFLCLQHMAAVRQVFNPLEKDDVIGITNYIDVGIQLHVPLSAAAATADGKGAAGATPFSSSSRSSSDDTLAGLRLAASWQVSSSCR